MRIRFALPWTFAFSFAAIVACSSSSSTPPAETFAGSCSDLASRCHPVKTPLGVECHELGHEGDDAKCGPRKDECLAECPETDGGHPPPEDGGSADVDAATADAASDTGADAGPDACAAYCTCMAATCASEPGYPFADEAACLSACSGFTAENRTCFAMHCETAKTAANKKHDCEHASGTIECH